MRSVLNIKIVCVCWKSKYVRVSIPKIVCYSKVYIGVHVQFVTLCTEPSSVAPFELLQGMRACVRACCKPMHNRFHIRQSFADRRRIKSTANKTYDLLFLSIALCVVIEVVGVVIVGWMVDWFVSIPKMLCSSVEREREKEPNE